MCEFFAIIGANTKVMAERAEATVRAMAVRQGDGLGLLAIDKDGSYAIRRSLSDRWLVAPPTERKIPFAETFSQRLGITDTTWALIWHARFGTTGSKTIDDVHPFVGERYIVSHNGVLAPPKRYTKVGGGYDSHDTRALLRAVERKGFAGWRGFAGYGAMFTYDMEEQTLHIHHDNQAFLYTRCADQDTVIIATKEVYGSQMAEVKDNVHIVMPVGSDPYAADVHNWKGFAKRTYTNSYVPAQYPLSPSTIGGATTQALTTTSPSGSSGSSGSSRSGSPSPTSQVYPKDSWPSTYRYDDDVNEDNIGPYGA